MKKIKLTIYTNEFNGNNELSKVQNIYISKNACPKRFTKTQKLTNKNISSNTKQTFSKSPTTLNINTTAKTKQTNQILNQNQTMKFSRSATPSNILKHSQQWNKTLPNNQSYTNNNKIISVSNIYKPEPPIRVHSNNIFNQRANSHISSAISTIIDLKVEITLLKQEEDLLLLQKQKIINYYENSMALWQKDILNQDRVLYENQSLKKKEEDLQNEYDALLGQRDRMNIEICDRVNNILDINTKYDSESKEFDERMKLEHEEWEALKCKTRENLPTLSQNDVYTINLLLRIILISVLHWNESDILNNLFPSHTPVTSIDQLITNWITLINNKNKKNVKLLKAYFLTIANNNIEDIKTNFFGNINNINSVNYRSGMNQNYVNSIRAVYAETKEKIISEIKDKDKSKQNSGIISFDNFLQILIENSNDISLSDSIFEYIIYIMKADCYYGNCFLLDLAYDSFINLLWNNDNFIANTEIEDDYKNKIKEYWINNQIEFNDFIKKYQKFFIYDVNRSRFWSVRILNKILTKKGIIGKNKVIPRTDELMNINWDHLKAEYEGLIQKEGEVCAHEDNSACEKSKNNIVNIIESEPRSSENRENNIIWIGDEGIGHNNNIIPTIN